MRNTDVAWAAGLVDGEGCITIVKRNQNPPTYQARLSVANTDRAALDLLASWWGGTVYTSDTRRVRTCFSWHVGGQAAINVVEALVPYLRIKLNQATAMLAYTRHLRHELDLKELERREAYYQLLRQMKRR